MVSLTPAINFRLFSRCHRRLFFSGVNNTDDKFIAGINDTADQRKSVTKINLSAVSTFIAGVVDTANKHSFKIISANFRKKPK
jgi:hypothetical protein